MRAKERVDRIGANWISRVRIGLIVALGAVTLDHATKAVAIPLPSHATNPARDFWWWLPIVTFLAGCLIPSTCVAVCLGLTLGGASSNIVDAFVWPGGTPDFIRDVDGALFNLADVFIAAGLLGAFICATVFGVRRIRTRLRPKPG
jgi:Signal peptidase (SPase) II